MSRNNGQDLLADFNDYSSLDPDLGVHLRHQQGRQMWQERFVRLCQENSGDRPLTVAIMGAPGAGKSSLVNTIAASLSDDTWSDYAHSAAADSRMVYVKGFPKCCHGSSTRYRDVNLPTLLEITGFDDVHSERQREHLRIICNGRLPVDGPVTAVNYRDGGPARPDRYREQGHGVKVDRVLLVTAATSEIPVNLISCLVDVAGRAGIPVFGVMSKMDKVTEKQLKERERQFFEALQLNGNHRLLRCSNYCDDVDPACRRTETFIAELDIPILKFMSQMVKVRRHNEDASGCDAAEESQPSTSPSLRHRQRQTDTPGRQAAPPAPRAENPQSWNGSQLTFIAKVFFEILVVLAFYYFMKPNIDMKKVSDTCRYIKSRPEINSFTSVRSLCKHLVTSSSLGPALLLLVYAGVRAVLVSLEYRHNPDWRI
ncbi:uncharacterized protein LOC124117310 [Haliotis rufescens]|uniref:uncharacterized protein LOC124117310 n=1 Tax=Haliotis rufescens TaxID=6454 RepID=UPI00201E8BC7|nr:uncharacterized protein LOC124117310 [Haliotis rufescens]